MSALDERFLAVAARASAHSLVFHSHTTVIHSQPAVSAYQRNIEQNGNSPRLAHFWSRTRRRLVSSGTVWYSNEVHRQSVANAVSAANSLFSLTPTSSPMTFNPCTVEQKHHDRISNTVGRYENRLIIRLSAYKYGNKNESMTCHPTPQIGRESNVETLAL